VAVCSVVTKAADPTQACRRLKDRIVKLVNERP
jgi:hypothetical protein